MNEKRGAGLAPEFGRPPASTCRDSANQPTLRPETFLHFAPECVPSRGVGRLGGGFSGALRHIGLFGLAGPLRCLVGSQAAGKTQKAYVSSEKHTAEIQSHLNLLCLLLL